MASPMAKSLGKHESEPRLSLLALPLRPSASTAIIFFFIVCTMSVRRICPTWSVADNSMPGVSLLPDLPKKSARMWQSPLTAPRIG